MSAQDPYAARIQQARELADAGDRDGALAILYSTVVLEPDQRDAWWLIAQLSPHTLQRQEALQRVLQIDPAFEPAREMAARYSLFNAPTTPNLQAESGPQAGSAPATQLSQRPPLPSEAAPPPDTLPPGSTPYIPPPQAAPPPTPPRQPAVPPPAYTAPPPQAAPPPAYTAPPPQAAPPPAYTAPPQPAPPPAYTAPPPAYSPPPAPAPRVAPAEELPPHRPPAPRPAPVEREVVYVERKSMQPLLVINGGCTSGCFSFLLTFFIVNVLGVLLVGNTVSAALQSVKALPAGESLPASMIPAVAMTAVLAFLQSNPITVPLGILGTADTGSIFGDALQSLWTSMGYPAGTGSAIVAELGGISGQISAASWVLPALFFGGWLLLAFFFVFLRARSYRFLHWMLSTIGLWLALVAGVWIASFLARLLAGGA